MYASMLFINEVNKYTGNLSFAKDFTYPLLDGFSAFWSCLLNGTTGDGFLHDANSLAADSEFEHQSATFFLGRMRATSAGSCNAGASRVEFKVALRLEESGNSFTLITVDTLLRNSLCSNK
jgi:hypothetical protein